GRADGGTDPPGRRRFRGARRQWSRRGGRRAAPGGSVLLARRARLELGGRAGHRLDESGAVRRLANPGIPGRALGRPGMVLSGDDVTKNLQDPPLSPQPLPPPGYVLMQQQPADHAESGDLFDWQLIGSYAGFVLHSIRRHKLLFSSIWLGIIAF